MKILLLHNYYQQRGGEDAVFELERDLLLKYGHEVNTLTFNNEQIRSPLDALTAGLSSFYNPGPIKQVQEKLKSFKPDILHVHNFFPLASPGIFYAAQQSHTPVVMTLHNYRLLCANALLLRENRVCEDCVQKPVPLPAIVHRCYRGSATQSAALALMTSTHRALGTWKNRIDGYIALTEFARKKFIESAAQIPADKIFVKPNFIFDQGAASSQEKETYFLYVGRLASEKGITLLLEAFQANGLPLKIAGTGPLEQVVARAAESHGNIEFLGQQEKSAVMGLLKKARALVFSSFWYEGFPMVIAEALSTGTPVIAPRIGGLPEIIEDSTNGLLYPPGELDGFQQKIQSLAGDNALHERLCLNARESYVLRYTPEINHDLLTGIYRQVIQTHAEQEKNTQLPHH